MLGKAPGTLKHSIDVGEADDNDKEPSSQVHIPFLHYSLASWSKRPVNFTILMFNFLCIYLSCPWKGCTFLHSHEHNLGLFFLSFLWPHLQHMEIPRLGSNRKCSHWPTPEPQQHGIGATSATYTTAQGNAGSLTH